MKTEERYKRRDGAIHEAFGLTYASWLVLPRTLLRDMPTEWQTQFVKLLDEYHDVVRDKAPEYNYDINIQFKKNGKFCSIPEYFSNYKYPKHEDLLEK